MGKKPEKNASAQAMGKLRWAKMTPEARAALIAKMTPLGVAARKKKKALTT